MNFKTILALLVAAMPFALAETYVPGTRVSYSVIRDPMTDDNHSIIFMDELNDTGSHTYLSLKCAAGNGWIFGISTKHTLMPPTQDLDSLDAELDQNYLVSYRMGSQQPASIRHLSPTSLSGRLRPETLTFYDTNANNAIAQGLVDGQKLTLRIQPISDAALVKRNLDYVFMPKGFAQAFRAVNYCR